MAYFNSDEVQLKDQSRKPIINQIIHFNSDEVQLKAPTTATPGTLQAYFNSDEVQLKAVMMSLNPNATKFQFR